MENIKNIKNIKIKIFVIVFVLLLVFIVVLQNTQSVETKVLFMTITTPRAFLIFLTFILGFILGSVSALIFSQKNKKLPNDKY